RATPANASIIGCFTKKQKNGGGPLVSISTPISASAICFRKTAKSFSRNALNTGDHGKNKSSPRQLGGRDENFETRFHRPGELPARPGAGFQQPLAQRLQLRSAACQRTGARGAQRGR